MYFWEGRGDFIVVFQVAIYTGGSELVWREVGGLPSKNRGLRAALVDNLIFVTGGNDGSWPVPLLNSISVWDPSTETWKHAGNLAEMRWEHAAIAIPSSMIECLAMP